MLEKSRSRAPWSQTCHAAARHWWPIAAGITGTALLAIASICTRAHFSIGKHSYAWNTHLLIAGVFFAGLAAISTGHRQVRLAKLEQRVQERNTAANSGAQSVLRLVFTQLEELRSSANHYSNERVSLYRWCKEHDHFRLIGRCSAGPTYQASLGRGHYPTDQGCMGEAWTAGHAAITDLPPAGRVKPWESDWLQAQVERGLSATAAAGLVMPSRCYFAFRIDGYQESLGLLVFESVNSASEAEQDETDRALSLTSLDSLQRRVSGRLAELLRQSAFISDEELHELLPDVPSP